MPFAPPVFNLFCTVWPTTDGSRKSGAPLLQHQPCNARSPRAREVSPLYQFPIPIEALDLVVGFPLGLTIQDQFGGVNLLGGPHWSLIELPEGSGELWSVIFTRVEARGYPNAHINCYCTRSTALAPSS